MIIFRILILLLLLIGIDKAHAQSRFSAGADLSQIIVHTDNINFESERSSYGFMLSYTRNTNPENESYKKRGLPKVSLNFYYADPGLDGLGKMLGFIPSLSFVHTISDKWHLESTVGVGIGYATKYYDRQPWSDTIYNALGSHWNNFTRFSENLFYTLPSGNQLSLALAFAHLSSSSSSAPNYGINAASVGLGYHWIKPGTPPYGKPLQAHAATSRNSLHMGFSWTIDKRVVGLAFPIFTVGYKHHWVNPERLASWFVGAEIIRNNKSLAILDWRQMNYIDRPLSRELEYYLMVGREWYIGDFGVCLGIDLGYNGDTRKFDHLEKPTLFYYPFNIDYSTQSLWRNLYLGLGLCTRLANAQYLDLTIGTFL